MDDLKDQYLEIGEIIDTLSDKNDEDKQKRIKALHSRLMRVSPELFAEFLIEKGAKRNCLACGSSKISVHQSSHLDHDKLNESSNRNDMQTWINATVYYVSFIKIDADKDSILSNLQYRTNCLNCGFISHYRSVTVLEWVESLDSFSGDEK